MNSDILIGIVLVVVGTAFIAFPSAVGSFSKSSILLNEDKSLSPWFKDPFWKPRAPSEYESRLIVIRVLGLIVVAFGICLIALRNY
jgi:hypothetical protein